MLAPSHSYQPASQSHLTYICIFSIYYWDFVRQNSNLGGWNWPNPIHRALLPRPMLIKSMIYVYWYIYLILFWISDRGKWDALKFRTFIDECRNFCQVPPQAIADCLVAVWAANILDCKIIMYHNMNHIHVVKLAGVAYLVLTQQSDGVGRRVCIRQGNTR